MTLEGPLRQAETARAELSRAARSSDGWSDKQRHDFDAQRLRPLDEAGRRLIIALQKAVEQCAKADRLLATK